MFFGLGMFACMFPFCLFKRCAIYEVVLKNRLYISLEIFYQVMLLESNNNLKAKKKIAR